MGIALVVLVGATLRVTWNNVEEYSRADETVYWSTHVLSPPTLGRIRRSSAGTSLIHPTGQHGFDTRDDDERSREIIREALEFFVRHLSL